VLGLTNGRQPAASGKKKKQKKATHTRGRSVVFVYPVTQFFGHAVHITRGTNPDLELLMDSQIITGKITEDMF